MLTHAQVDFESARRLLEVIEALPRDATGMVRFQEHGTVLVDSRIICWARAHGLRERLTDLLRLQRNPPLCRDYLRVVLEDCRRQHKPLGEALLATGEITEQGLRQALFAQVTSAVAHIAKAGCERGQFLPLADVRYDARFLFHPTEVLAGLGSLRDRALATAARRHLEQVLDDGTPRFAFANEMACTFPVPMVALYPGDFTVTDVMDLGGHCRQILGGRARAVQTAWHSGSVLSWEFLGMSCVAVCQAQDASHLVDRMRSARARMGELPA